eukprot:scaffold341556_cov17-Prasinocladus_malaysianus.AAC.1
MHQQADGCDQSATAIEPLDGRTKHCVCSSSFVRCWSLVNDIAIDFPMDTDFSFIMMTYYYIIKATKITITSEQDVKMIRTEMIRTEICIEILAVLVLQ